MEGTQEVGAYSTYARDRRIPLMLENILNKVVDIAVIYKNSRQEE